MSQPSVNTVLEMWSFMRGDRIVSQGDLTAQGV